MGFVYLILYSIWWVPGHTSLGCHISQCVFGQDDQIISLLWCHINIFQHCLSWVSSCCNSAWNLVTLLLTSFFVGSKITQNTRNQRPNWTDLFTKRSKKRRMNLSGALWFAWVILSAEVIHPVLSAMLLRRIRISLSSCKCEATKRRRQGAEIS